MKKVTAGPKPATKVLNPFRRHTGKGIVFEMLLKGCSLPELIRLIRSHHLNVTNTIRVLRRGYNEKYMWEYEETNGRIRVGHTKPIQEEKTPILNRL